MNKKVILYLGFAFSLVFVSCKPKQSNYKSIYETAKDQEDTQEDVYIEETVYTYDSTNEDNMNTSVRKEVFTPVTSGDESNLKKYNVVISSLGMYENAQVLKKQLITEGYNPIIVQNSQGMYRVIIASAPTKDQAINDRATILAKFRQQGDNEELRKKYGISFNDWWILERSN